MANIDHPHGLRWVRNVNGAQKPPVVHYDVAADDTIYRGSLCKLDDSGYATMIDADGDAASNTLIDGVALEYVNAPAAIQEGVPFVTAHGTIFEIQCGDTELAATRAAFMALIDSGNEYEVLGGASGDSLGNSITEIDAATAAGGCLIIVGFDDRPDNTWGAFQDVYVRVAVALLADAPEFVTN